MDIHYGFLDYIIFLALYLNKPKKTFCIFAIYELLLRNTLGKFDTKKFIMHCVLKILFVNIKSKKNAIYENAIYELLRRSEYLKEYNKCKIYLSRYIYARTYTYTYTHIRVCAIFFPK